MYIDVQETVVIITFAAGTSAGIGITIASLTTTCIQNLAMTTAMIMDGVRTVSGATASAVMKTATTAMVSEDGIGKR